MWCVPKLTAEYIERMEDILALYAKPYNPLEPVICMDEKSKQLLGHGRSPIPMTETNPIRREDYEYKRRGTKNIFSAVEPKGGRHFTSVTDRRTKIDFATFIKSVVDDPDYQNAETIHLVLDNLNTHFPPSFVLAFGEEGATRILAKITFHYTPKHASWLNMAEIELSVMEKQCLRQRIPTVEKLTTDLAAWTKERNERQAKIQWKFTVVDARQALKYGGQN